MTGGSESFDERGIIPWTISYLFEQIQNDKEKFYEVSASYMEIYNNVGYDLLYENEEGVRELELLPRV